MIDIMYLSLASTTHIVKTLPTNVEEVINDRLFRKYIQSYCLC